MAEPEFFFIVPYRNRLPHLEVFMNHMEKLLEDLKYKILICHQCDNRPFNRGAMKNIGFKYVKDNYPKTYKNKTLVFNDVDNVVALKHLANWKTEKGTVKHFYGADVKKAGALGGIFSINGEDFEKTNGFPNYWAWGYEDNAMYWRVKHADLKIDYSQFSEMGTDKVVVFWHGTNRMVNEADTWSKFKLEVRKSGWKGEGLHEITGLTYEKIQARKNIIAVNIKDFKTPTLIPKLVKREPKGSFVHQDTITNYNNVFGKIFN